MTERSGWRVWVLGAALTAAATVRPAAADTLVEALSDAYNGNATIQAQRYQLRQTDEQLPQALAGWRPTVNITGAISRQHQYFGLAFPGVPTIEDTTPRNAALSINQPIFHAGVGADVDRAKAVIQGGQAQLKAVEQEQLLAAATAYLDVYRDQSVVELNANLVQVLGLNQHDVQLTFNAGAATETDTSQAAARLAGAAAGRLAADARLRTSLARFREVVARDAGKLDAPALLGQVPASEDDAMALALGGNPTLIAARDQLEAAQHQVDVARAALLPKVDGVAQAQHIDDELIKGVRENAMSIGLQATVPLYEGGAEYSRIRAAHDAVSQAEKRLLAVERQIRDQVSTAWNALQAARAQQVQFRSQIDANNVALRDTAKEVTVGTRTRLDTLNAQQELFASRVSLVGAEHDAFIASFQLEQVAGIFNPAALGLTVANYDPAGHLDAVKDEWIGTEPPAP